MNILEQDKNGRLVISKEVATKLSSISSQIDELSNDEKELRKEILEAMQANNIDGCVSCGMKFSQIIPKPIGKFDINSFIENQSEELVEEFTTATVQEEFDVDKFKAENPELYEKYVRKNYEFDVDTKKLQDVFPKIFEQYYHEEQSNKPITLRITKTKE